MEAVNCATTSPLRTQVAEKLFCAPRPNKLSGENDDNIRAGYDPATSESTTMAAPTLASTGTLNKLSKLISFSAMELNSGKSPNSSAKPTNTAAVTMINAST